MSCVSLVRRAKAPLAYYPASGIIPGRILTNWKAHLLQTWKVQHP